MKEPQGGGPGRTSNQGRKEASGGELEPQKVGNVEGDNRRDASSRGGGNSRSKTTRAKTGEPGKKAPARRK